MRRCQVQKTINSDEIIFLNHMQETHHIPIGTWNMEETFTREKVVR